MFAEHCYYSKKLAFVEKVKLNLFWRVEYLYVVGFDCFSYSEGKIVKLT